MTTEYTTQGAPVHKGLLLHPLAHAKMQILCRACSTEIGFYCVTHPDNPLYVVDVVAPKQECTSGTFEFDPHGLPDIYDHFEAREIPVERFNRILAHTHPGNSATPSSVDWESFQEPTRESLGHWGMLIMAQDGSMTFHFGVWVGTGIVVMKMPVEVPKSAPFEDFLGELNRETLVENLSRVSTPTRTVGFASSSASSSTDTPHRPRQLAQKTSWPPEHLVDESDFDDFTGDSQPINRANRQGGTPKGKERAAMTARSSGHAAAAGGGEAGSRTVSTKTLRDGSKLTVVSHKESNLPEWNRRTVAEATACSRPFCRAAFDMAFPQGPLESLGTLDVYNGLDFDHDDYTERLAFDLLVLANEALDYYSIKTIPYTDQVPDHWCRESWQLCRAYYALPPSNQLDVDREIRNLTGQFSVKPSTLSGASVITTGDDCCVWVLAVLRRIVREPAALAP